MADQGKRVEVVAGTGWTPQGRTRGMLGGLQGRELWKRGLMIVVVMVSATFAAAITIPVMSIGSSGAAT